MYQYKRLQEHAYDYLKEMILNEQLEPDIIYSETKLSEEIQMSRTPIRDALQRLNQENYITILPSKGFLLRELTKQDVIEIFEMRSAIEGYCTLLLATQYQGPKAIETIAQLFDNLSQQKEIANTNRDINAFVALDQKFHEIIVGYAGNSVFDATLHNYMYRIKKLARQSLAHSGRLEKTLDEHTNILQAIQQGNQKEVYQTTLVHMETPKYLNLSDFHMEL